VKQFTLGSVEIYERTKAIGSLQDVYFRILEFSSFMNETDGMLQLFFRVPPKYHTIIMASMITGEKFGQCYENLIVRMIFRDNCSFFYFDICDYDWTEIDSADNLLKAKEIHNRNN